VELSVPRGWELSEQRSYPGIIARGFEHQTGARLSLAAEHVAADETLAHYVERSQASLLKLGYRVSQVARREEQVVVMDTLTPDRRRQIRQAYLLEAGVGYVLTEAVRADAARVSRPFDAFEETLKSLTIHPAPPPSPAAPEPAPP
jgi:hypothetical protein